VGNVVYLQKNIARMNTITVVPRSNTVLPFLEELLSNPAWVKKVVVNEVVEDIPNKDTQKAIKEAREGKGIRCKDVNDFFTQLKS
jgi:hypothetical protein